MNPLLSRYASDTLRHVGDLQNHKVLIVGDIGLDEYIWGQVKRISPEAPVPIVEVEKEESRLGLAANVAQNISGLGGIPYLISVMGDDGAAEQLKDLLRSAQVAPDFLIVDAARPTTRKARVMVHNHHIVRVDYERRQFIHPEIENAVVQKAKECMSDVSAVILQDYAKGVVSESLAQKIIALAREHGKKILADPNRSTPLHYYRGIDIMTPNYDESVALSGEVLDELRLDSNLLNRIGQRLMELVGSKQMIITRSKDGMRLFEDGKFIDLPTFARQVSDVTGA
jgi:rfaE bifunctional protein kinase chain/domain